MSEIALVFLLLGLLIILFFNHLFNKVRQTRSCYLMYEVRDDLISLVATGVLKEDSKVFNHFYKRVNSILSLAPKIGFDDILNSMISAGQYVDVEKGLKDAQKQLSKIENSKEMNIPEVQTVVGKYYCANAQMILAHSSLLRFIYLSEKFRFIEFASHLPTRLKNKFKIFKFNMEKSNLITH
jgi:hypothetical protein